MYTLLGKGFHHESGCFLYLHSIHPRIRGIDEEQTWTSELCISAGAVVQRVECWASESLGRYFEPTQGQVSSINFASLSPGVCYGTQLQPKQCAQKRPNNTIISFLSENMHITGAVLLWCNVSSTVCPRILYSRLVTRSFRAHQEWLHGDSSWKHHPTRHAPWILLNMRINQSHWNSPQCWGQKTSSQRRHTYIRTKKNHVLTSM